jgi:hypothetical protein
LEKPFAEVKSVLTFAARKRDSGFVLITYKIPRKNIFQIYFGEVKKVHTFAVPKQGVLDRAKAGSDFRRIKN